MDVKLPIGEEDVGMSNPIKEEDEMDSWKEEEIWRSRQERMNNALAAVRTMAGQDPAKTYVDARGLAEVIKGANVEQFISTIERLADHTDLFAIFDFLGLHRGSLLHIAAGTGEDDVLRLLLDYGFHHLIAAQNDCGDTPLHMVAKGRGSTRAAEMLIRRARNQNLILRMKNKHGNTALHEAVLNCHVEMVRFLLSEDLEPVYLENAEQKSSLYLAFDTNNKYILETLFSLSLEPSRIQGLPPVHGAVVHENYDLLTQIFETNMKLFAMTDSWGGNVFHFAAHTNRVRVFKLLGPETEYLALKRDMNGDLPIHIASKMGYVHLIQKLHPVSDLLNGKGQTVLHVAAKYGQTSVVRYILRHPELGKLINERDYAGNTPLHLAAKHLQPSALITLLLDKRIKPFLLNHKCLTARNIVGNQFRGDFSLRERLAIKALRSTSDVTTDLLVRRPEARDNAFSKFYSRKWIPKNDLLKDAINTRLVVAALVTTVTFAAGFTDPGGFNSSDTASKDDRGMATMLDKRLFQAFVICNTIAMFSSMIAVISLMFAQNDLHKAEAGFDYATVLLTIALPAMSATFLTGVTLTVGNLPWLVNTIFYLGLPSLLMISGATLLPYSTVFQSHRRPIRLLNSWFILAYIYLWRVPTYIVDDQEEDGMEDR